MVAFVSWTFETNVNGRKQSTTTRPIDHPPSMMARSRHPMHSSIERHRTPKPASECFLLATRLHSAGLRCYRARMDDEIKKNDRR